MARSFLSQVRCIASSSFRASSSFLLLTGRHFATAARPSSVAQVFSEPLLVPASPTPAQIDSFRMKGYTQLESVLPSSLIAHLVTRIDLCFTGKFDTHNYMDEWYWRPELNPPSNITRHCTNIWKADRGVATILCSEPLARFAAQLAGMKGVRMGSDSVWFKPPEASQSQVAFHTDAMYIPYRPLITMWISLNDIHAGNGPLEHIPGSHLWPAPTEYSLDGIHLADGGYRARAIHEAKRAGVPVESVKFNKVACPAGTVAFHDGRLWHGSGPNLSGSWRRSIAVHLISADQKHGPNDGYIYGRYKKWGIDEMDEAFFPIIYSSDPTTRRSPFLKSFLDLTNYPAPHARD